MRFEPTPQRFTTTDEPIIMRFNHTDERELFEIAYMPGEHYQN